MYLLSWLQERQLQEPQNSLRKVFFRIVTHAWFERAVIVLILVNIVLLSLDHYGQSDTWTTVLRYGNDVIVALFVLELILKFAGLHESKGERWHYVEGFVFLLCTSVPMYTCKDPGRSAATCMHTFRVCTCPFKHVSRSSRF